MLASSSCGGVSWERAAQDVTLSAQSREIEALRRELVALRVQLEQLAKAQR